MARTDLEKFAAKNVSASASGNSGPAVFHYGGEEQRGPGTTHPNFRRTAAGIAPTGGASIHRSTARPFHPLFSSPDRLQLPTQLAQLNQYWRLYYNVDPVIGGAIDMHGDMPWSGAYLVMDEPGEKSSSIMHIYEDMMNQTELLSWLPRLTREYMVIGEVFPFMFWDDKEGIFTHITLHNPDYVEVVDSPLIDDDPILTLRPSQDLRRILQSTDPRYIRLRNKLPADIMATIAGGKNIPLDPVNASHLARRAFPYDIRGTSIMGRMFRILMYEDAVFNGQIQQAQRHALPLRVFKLGDQQKGWIPSPQNMDDFVELLAEAETDPLAAIVYHYGLQVEYHGIEGKQLKLTNEWDLIERAKLIALGINKAFLHGEVTYASANAGLQVLMMRYRTLRDMVVSDWIYKKVFATMAELNGFYRKQKKSDPEGLPESRDPSMERKTMYLKDRLKEIHGINDPDKQAYEMVKIQPLIEEVNFGNSRRFVAMSKQGDTQKSKTKKGYHLIYPHLQFEKRLDVRQDEAILRFWSELAQKGWISPRSVVQGAGLDYDAEMATIGQDAAQIARNQLLMASISGEEGGAGGGGGGMGMGGIGIGEGEGIGAMPPGGAETGEGSGAPGSGPAGGIGKPTAPASTVRDVMRRTADYKFLPEDVAQDVRTILTRNDSSTDIFTKG